MVREVFFVCKISFVRGAGLFWIGFVAFPRTRFFLARFLVSFTTASLRIRVSFPRPDRLLACWARAQGRNVIIDPIGSRDLLSVFWDRLTVFAGSIRKFEDVGRRLGRLG